MSCVCKWSVNSRWMKSQIILWRPPIILWSNRTICKNKIFLCPRFTALTSSWLAADKVTIMSALIILIQSLRDCKAAFWVWSRRRFHIWRWGVIIPKLCLCRVPLTLLWIFKSFRISRRYLMVQWWSKMEQKTRYLNPTAANFKITTQVVQVLLNRTLWEPFSPLPAEQLQLQSIWQDPRRQDSATEYLVR